MQENKYERYFSNWLSDVLPDSMSGMFISDIDFFLYNITTKKFIIIELKTRGNTMKEWQKRFYNEISKRLTTTNAISEMKFVWTYLLEFEWEDFYDWTVHLSWTRYERQQVNEEILADFLFNKLNLYVWT